MVQLLLAYFFGSTALLLALYGILRVTQAAPQPLSPARRAALLGGVSGVVAFLCLLAWWTWFNGRG